MFIALCLVLVLAVLSTLALFTGRWRSWMVYVGAHAVLAIMLAMQSSAGMSQHDRMALLLFWIAMALYLVVAAIMAVVRAFVLMLARRDLPR